MYVKILRISNFRSFTADNLGGDEEVKLNLGKQVTCIAGHNGIGKTTILAALSNCGELKTADGKHLNGKPFRGDYSDLIKGDRNFDSTGEKVKLQFGKHEDTEDLEIDELSFRATFQKRTVKTKTFKPAPAGDGLFIEETVESSIDRYRLIPQKTQDREHEKKLNWPTYYLGLSRLYPIGESQSVNDKQIRHDDEILQLLSHTYKSILSMDQELRSSSIVQPSDAPNKYGAGITTSSYGPLANSAGQDNLGQIILTILSFKKLKETLQEDYHGGLLLIDELDSTLHPAAQAKLFNYLLEKSKELQLQIIFTTHSLSLIQHIIKTDKLHHRNEALRLIYLTKPRGQIEIKHNPTLEFVKNDLNNEYSNTRKSTKMPLLMEDAAAREFLNWIFSEREIALNLMSNDTSIGWTEIVSLIKSYSEYFYNSLIILDPDVSVGQKRRQLEEKIQGTVYCLTDDERIQVAERRKVLFLPGTEPLETQFWKLISSLPSDDTFYFYPTVDQLQVVKRSLVEQYEEELRQTPNNELAFHKRWFDYYLPKELRPAVYTRWAEANAEAVDEFIHDVTAECDKVSGITLHGHPRNGTN